MINDRYLSGVPRRRSLPRSLASMNAGRPDVSSFRRTRHLVSYSRCERPPDRLLVRSIQNNRTASFRAAAIFAALFVMRWQRCLYRRV